VRGTIQPNISSFNPAERINPFSTAVQRFILRRNDTGLRPNLHTKKLPASEWEVRSFFVF
ncbi:MAG: hypothetical protein ACI4PO_08160, partial [Faecousia sp.]